MENPDMRKTPKTKTHTFLLLRLRMRINLPFWLSKEHLTKPMSTVNVYLFELLRCAGQKVLSVLQRVRFRAFYPSRLESLWAMRFRDEIGFVRHSKA